MKIDWRALGDAAFGISMVLLAVLIPGYTYYMLFVR